MIKVKIEIKWNDVKGVKVPDSEKKHLIDEGMFQASHMIKRGFIDGVMDTYLFINEKEVRYVGSWKLT